MLHDESFITGFLIGRKQGGRADPTLIKRAAALSDFCEIWRIPKYNTVTDVAGNNLTVAVQRMRRMTYVVDVMRTAYGISMHTADGHILCFGAHPQGALTHSSCLKDSSITPADEGAHPVNWTEAKSFLIVSDSLVAVVAEHPELHTPILLTGFARVLAAKTSDKDNWRPISETALPNYLDIYKDSVFDLTQSMDLVDDLTDRVFDSDNESLLYENGDAGYFRGIRCIRSPDGHGQYIKDGTINNFNFIGRFEATGTCAARNELANTSQMYLCGYRRNLGDAGSPQIVVDRWWMTITGTSPVWRGLLPRSACTYDYNADEIDLEHPTYQDGYNKGYQDGLAAGGGGGEDPGGDYDEGYQTGYQEGYQAGYAAGVAASGGGDDGYTLGPAEDGATELYISIEAAQLKEQQLCFCQTVANGVSIDWGDGSAAETAAGTGPVYPTHSYAAAGDYKIRLLPADGCSLTIGGGTSVVKTVFNDGTSVAGGRGVVLKKAVIGKEVTTVGRYAFQNCWNLEEVYVQDGVETLGLSCFQNCTGLHRIRLPSTLTSINAGSEFNGCYALSEINIPMSVTAIGGNAFQDCQSLKRISFPGIASIGASALIRCRGLQRVDLPATLTTLAYNFASQTINLREIHLAATTPPPLSGNLTTGYSNFVVYIPAGSLAAYSSANRWSSITAKLIEE